MSHFFLRGRDLCLAGVTIEEVSVVVLISCGGLLVYG